MSRKVLVALLLGVLLLAAPIAKADDDYADEGDDEGEDAEEGAAAEGGSDEKDVFVLTTKNFDDAIKKHKFVLAEFYAPWCGHCKSLAPQYAKAATALKSHDADVVLAKIDATQEGDLATKFGVQGYPTLKWFVDGEQTEYNGPRDADGIVNWVKKKTGPPAVLIDEADKLTEKEGEHAAIVVGYFKKLEGSDYDVFKAVAQKIEDALFVETTKSDVAKLAGLKHHGVAVIKNFKGAGEKRETETYSGKLHEEELKTWVQGERIPLTIEFNEANSDTIFNSGIKQQVLLWGKTKDVNPGSDVYDTYRKVAGKFKGKLVFVTVDNEGSSHEPVTNFFGLKDAEGPTVIGFFMDKNKKYKMVEKFNEKHLTHFAQGVVDGTAHVEYKSQPIPDNDKEGDVTIVVGKTVDKIVFDDKRDVLLEVYAPWCGHCKSLEPIYKKLAKRFKKVDSVVIAKMDGTENEHPQLEVKGFPTIFFVPAGSKEVLTYDESERTLKAFTKYIKEHAKVPYTLPKKEEKAAEKEGVNDDDKAAAKDEL